MRHDKKNEHEEAKRQGLKKRKTDDKKLDRDLEKTFPASDPITKY